MENYFCNFEINCYLCKSCSINWYNVCCFLCFYNILVALISGIRKENQYLLSSSYPAIELTLEIVAKQKEIVENILIRLKTKHGGSNKINKRIWKLINERSFPINAKSQCCVLKLVSYFQFPSKRYTVSRVRVYKFKRKMWIIFS